MNDIRSILEHLNIRFKVHGEHHHATKDFYQTNCCFCDPDGDSWRLGIAKSGSHSICWICGSHSIIDTLIGLAGITYHEAKELLRDVRPERIEERQHRGTLVLPKGIKPLSELKQHQRYLTGRGYNWGKIARLWNVQGIALAARLSWRLFIPVMFRGEIVSWTTRTISHDKSIERYISASEDEEKIGHKTLLYGEDLARHAIVIVEGATDAWRIGPGGVATLGIVYSTAQVNRMLRFPVRAICFDAEREAQKRAKRLLDTLSAFPGETLNIELETGKDAGEASMKEIKRIRKEIL